MSVASSYSYWLHPRIIESWLLLALPLSQHASAPQVFSWTLELRKLTLFDPWFDR